MAESSTKAAAEDDAAKDELRVGISSCLLGEKVRFDGGHKRYDFLTETLARFVRFVPVCPEVDLGLGTPRESIRLVRAPSGPRLVGSRTGSDHTEAMRRYSSHKARELEKLDLCGYVFKKDSPTCGLFRVRVYDHNNVPSRDGRGLFAEAMAQALPLLPMEEEGRLRDPRLRENFFERLFAYRRLQRLFRGRWSLGDLVTFHSREKLLLMAHDPEGYRALGRLVADVKGRARKELAAEYQVSFLGTLGKIATTRKHTNVLQHMLGHFKKLIDKEARAELVDVIHDFHAGLVPLIVPVTLLRHHVHRHGVEYLAGQTYLEPHPKELMLRNHV